MVYIVTSYIFARVAINTEQLVDNLIVIFCHNRYKRLNLNESKKLNYPQPSVDKIVYNFLEHVEKRKKANKYHDLRLVEKCLPEGEQWFT